MEKYVAAVNDHSSDLYFELCISSMDTPLVYLTLMVKDTPEKFLSQIGGLINLYLGISGLSVCAVLVFLLDRFKEWYRSRKYQCISESVMEIQTINVRQKTGWENENLDEKYGTKEEMRVFQQEIRELLNRRLDEVSEEIRA